VGKHNGRPYALQEKIPVPVTTDSIKIRVLKKHATMSYIKQSMGELLQSVAWQIKVNRSEVFQANFHAQ
jgi:hypothetical protein